MERSKFDTVVEILGEDVSKKVFKDIIKTEYFKKYGLEGTEDFLKENLKESPLACKIAMKAYQELIHG